MTDRPPLRPVTPDDAPALAELHGACFPHGWSADDMAGLFASPGLFGLIIDGKAMILLRQVLDEAEILTICTIPPARGQGLAASLLKEAGFRLHGTGVTRLFLEVAADNAAALALYRHHGFTEIGRRKGYYHSGADALTMSCDLPRTEGATS